MTTSIYRYLSLMALGATALLLPISCSRGYEGETVQSAYIEPLLPLPEYRFVHNGSSSVDTYECSQLSEPIEQIYRYMKQAKISYEWSYGVVYKLLREGNQGGLSPLEMMATSLSPDGRLSVGQDVEALLQASIKLSGYPNANPAVRRQVARPGQGGVVDVDIRSDNATYVDERGVEVGEAFNRLALGAIYLDRMLGVHLSEDIQRDASLRQAHGNAELITGRNYTALEHHWDLAYGYYNLLRPLLQNQGAERREDIADKIYRALAFGRSELSAYRYDMAMEQLRLVRPALSRALAQHTIDLLVGVNTLANLEERHEFAFGSLSRAYGMIGALQFARRADGTLYMSTDECRRWRDMLVLGTGLWDRERLLAGEDVEGSLRFIARELKRVFEL